LTESVPAVGELVRLSEDVSHHILRVTGIAPGETVELFDGSGLACSADLVEVDDGVAVLKVTALTGSTEGPHSVHLIVAQTRANTLDTVLRMATELGAASVQVVQAERCVAKGNKRDRWLRIVQAAAAQCGRTRIPDVKVPTSLMEAIESAEGRRLVCAPGAALAEVRVGDVTLLIGPEGGLSEAEVTAAQASGWVLAGLGNTVLRADTAAVAAMVRYG
jgi:16S rRNA (uracil1498-N3)-methyltransferase